MFRFCRDSVFRVTPKCARRYKKYDEVCFTFSLASSNFHVFMGVTRVFFLFSFHVNIARARKRSRKKKCRDGKTTEENGRTRKY